MKQIQGDLLKIESGVVLHQVNTRGITGGLAGALRRKFPTAFIVYDKLCRDNKSEELIGITQFGLDDSVWIGHVFGQDNPGPNTDFYAVNRALHTAARIISNSTALCRLPIYCPHSMGCGLGGGSWPDYLSLLVKHIPEIIIVQKYP